MERKNHTAVYPVDSDQEHNYTNPHNKKVLFTQKGNGQEDEPMNVTKPQKNGRFNRSNRTIKEDEPLSKKQTFFDTVKNGLQRMITYSKNSLNSLLEGGQKRNKMFMNRLIQHSKTSLERMKDEKMKQSVWRYVAYKAAFYLQYLIMPIVILFGTILCIVSLFFWNAYNLGSLPEGLEYLRYVDLVIAVSFSIELVYNVYTDEQGLVASIVEFENMLDISLIFHLFYSFAQGPYTKYFAIFNMLRSLRVTKLRYLTKLVTHYFKKFILTINTNDIEIDYDSLDEDGVLNRFIMDSIIKFTSSILLESTYFITFDELCDFRGFNIPRMSYIDAAYFTIVSFSTIGYGDIYPTLPITRLATSLALIINITVLSNFLGKLIDFLFQLSSFDKDYNFKDHVVVIGQIGDSLLNDFLHELVENDKIQEDLNGGSFNYTPIKVIIVRKEEPSEALRNMSIYFTDLEGNEVTFLKEDIFLESKKWFSKANLKYAKVLFSFSWQSEEERDYEYDKLISLVVTGIKEVFKELRIINVINSNFIEHTQRDSLYQGIEGISPFQLNNYLMSSSLENPGLTTILQHLVTLKTKTVSKSLIQAASSNKLMLQYIHNMQQEIYQFQIPEFYIGMSFQECVQMLYLYGLEFGANEILQGNFIQDHPNDDRKMTLIAVETQKITEYNSDDYCQKEVQVIEEESESKSNKESREFSETPRSKSQISYSSPISNSVPQERVDEEELRALNEEVKRKKLSLVDQPVLQQREKQTEILVNPQKYLLRKGDILYVICDNYEISKESQLLNSKEAPQYIKYATNQIAMQKNLGQKKNIPQLLQSLYEKLHQKYKGFDQRKCDSWKNEKPLSEEAQFNCTFNFMQEEFPDFLFEDHYVVFGTVSSFSQIMHIIRNYSLRPAVLFTEEKFDPFKWKETYQSNSNVFFIRGKYLKYEHLNRLNIPRAYKILILADLTVESFSDAIGLCLARILVDHYDRGDFLIELNDHSQISFLNKNPSFKNMECPSQFYPSFVSGQIHFTSMVSGILARVVYTPNWLQFYQDLVLPKQKKHQIFENKMIHFLLLDKTIIKQFSYFGQLQFALLENKPTIIAIGLVKKGIESKFGEQLIRQFLNQKFYSQLKTMYDNQGSKRMTEDNYTNAHKMKKQIKNQMKSVLSKVLGERFVLTNPSFYTRLDESDGVIVIGDLDLEDAKSRILSQRQSPKHQMMTFDSSKNTDINAILNQIEEQLKINNEKQRGEGYLTHRILKPIGQLKFIRECKKRASLKDEVIEELKAKKRFENELLRQLEEK